MNVNKNLQTVAAQSSSHMFASGSGKELRIIQQGENALIEARLLHKKLKSGYQFSDWMKLRIKEFAFEENKDFFASEKTEAKRGGSNAIDYLLTLDMAKELAMLERNDVGRQVRRYFIAKEKELRGISQLPKEVELFRGLKAKRVNDRKMFPYKEMVTRCGYNPKSGSGSRRAKYWQHFIKEGTILYITEEFSLHLFHQKRVFNNRVALKEMQPVLPYNFGETLLT